MLQAPSAFLFSRRLRRRAINPTPPKMVKAWGDGPLRPEEYPVLGHTQRNHAACTTVINCAPPTKPNALIGAVPLTLLLTCIYGGGWVHYVRSTANIYIYEMCPNACIFHLKVVFLWPKYMKLLVMSLTQRGSKTVYFLILGFILLYWPVCGHLFY